MPSSSTLSGPKPKLRQCIACRQLLDRQQLAKLTLGPALAASAWKFILPFDLTIRGQTLEGRSSYICPTVPCVKLALKKRAFSRTLRRALPNETQAYLDAWLQALQAETVLPLIVPRPSALRQSPAFKTD